MLKTYKALVVTLFTVALCSCIEKGTHSLSFATIPPEGWEANDTLTFIADTLPRSTMKGFELLLHTENYRYANIGFHLSIEQDSIVLYSDSIHTMLEESNPARGIARRCDYTIPITNLTLCDSMHTTVRVTHLMSEHTLKGIREIGIRIGSPVRHPGEVVWQVEW